MDARTYVPDWHDIVVYAAPRPQPTLLVDEEELRVIVGGLEPGGMIPPHPERRAVYHALEGEGVLRLGRGAAPVPRRTSSSRRRARFAGSRR